MTNKLVAIEFCEKGIPIKVFEEKLTFAPTYGLHLRNENTDYPAHGNYFFIHHLLIVFQIPLPLK